jgi:hypothetical protein
MGFKFRKIFGFVGYFSVTIGKAKHSRGTKLSKIVKYIRENKNISVL